MEDYSQKSSAKIFKRIEDTIITKTTEEMDIYVATTGSDDIGDGSVGNPYLTIQYALDKIPKFLANRINIYVADGVYNLNSRITLKGFIGNNIITIIGNEANPSNCKLDGGSNSISIFRAMGCVVYIKIAGFYITRNTRDVTNHLAAIQSMKSLDVRVYNCILEKFYHGLQGYHTGNIHIQDCDLKDNKHAIWSTMSNIYSQNNSSSIINEYGLWADRGIIYKFGTQPTGSTANQGTYAGGQIW